MACRGRIADPLRDANVDTNRCQTYTWDDGTNHRKASPRVDFSLPAKTGKERLTASGVFPAGESVVTKKEIVRTIAEEIGLTQLKTKEIVQKTFDAIVETLVEDHRIELRNFGVFEVKKRAARKARNPRTGEKVDVAEKFVVTFKPGKEMEERVRELERRAAEEAAERRLAEERAAAAAADPSPNGQYTPDPPAQDASPGGPNSGNFAGYDRAPHDSSGS